MLDPSIALVLSSVFVASVVWTVAHSPAAHRTADGDGPAGLITINHVVMSGSMIVMAWWAGGLISAVVQIGAFAVFTGCWIVIAIRRDFPVSRMAAATHVGLNLAMIWMAAMPLTMPGMTGTTGMSDMGGMSGMHHDDGAAGSSMDPGSATAQLDATSVLTAVSVGLCAAALLWWLSRLVRGPHRSAAGSHVLMSAGMVAMLVAMH